MSMLITANGQWNTSERAYSPVITHIDERGQKRVSDLKILSVSGYHQEFGEMKADLIVIDQFGETFEICEDLIWQ